MDYEKKYKEAIERAKVWKEKSGMPKNKQGILDDIFPELKESEDERIRKAIIEFFENCNIKHSDWIAWLEKQAKLVEEYEDKLDRCACESFNKGYKAAIEHQKEKQGEQKSFAKYKVGDILVSEEEDRRHIYKVDGITNYGTYLLLDLEDGYTRNESVYICDIAMHLWTIEDAKNGDVFVASDKSLFIYDGTINEDGNVGFHVAFTEDMYIILNSDDGCGWEEKDSCHPANKEQRDLLFQKMKEARYEFDFEKLELSKIRKNFK